MRVLDISAPIRTGMPGFPTDPPVQIERIHDMARGSPYNLSRVTISSHTGTHVDPPLHFVAHGTPADRLDLNALNGPCRVVDVPAERTSVDERAVARIPGDAERVLFRTSNSQRWADATAFFPDYVAMAPAAARPLVDRKMRLVGIDSQSIERDTDGTFPVHRTLLSAGIPILEGVRLAEVPEGDYELRCFPLKIADGDGAPCRALLIAP
jgi:arylformamidase